MKIYNYFIILCILGISASCEIDNYEEPNAFFQGRVTYNGEPIRVGANEVRFQLYQPGFGNSGPFDVNLDLDGSFSGRLFNGEVKVKFIDGQGPFRAKFVNAQQGDTIFVPLNGNTMMDIEVLPFYMVRDPQFGKSENAITTSVTLEKVLTGDEGRDVEFVTLFLNGTALVSNNGDYNIAQSNADFSDLSNINLSTQIPEDYNEAYIFARVGVKIQGVEDLIFSPVERLEL